MAAVHLPPAIRDSGWRFKQRGIRFEALGVLGEDSKRNFERDSQPPNRPPRWVLSTALKVGDPGRMQRRAVGNLFLAEPPLEA